jgi:Cys-tRNA(Pro)/Cys-tRNA(Cys) deacylase
VTPAVRAAKRANIDFSVHEYAHDPNNSSFGMEAAEKLGLDPASVFKTLLVDLNGNSKSLAVAIVPVNAQLDLKAMAKACQAKKVTMAEPAIAERTTGYVVGGISPLGQKRPLPTVLDESALSFDTVFVSAGRRGMDIELKPADLKELAGAVLAKVSRS